MPTYRVTLSFYHTIVVTAESEESAFDKAWLKSPLSAWEMDDPQPSAEFSDADIELVDDDTQAIQRPWGFSPTNARQQLIDTIDVTGGVDENHHPYADSEWADLGAAYVDACKEEGVEPVVGK